MTELPSFSKKAKPISSSSTMNLHKAGLEKKILVGKSTFLIESKTLKGRKGFFLDHDSRIPLPRCSSRNQGKPYRV